jgi:methionyl aminopeptidase
VFGSRGIEVKTPAQIERMRAAGMVVAETLALVTAAARPGMTTADLDVLAEDHIRSCDAVPSFKGYSHPPFPASICASVNEQIVHGVPDDRVLAEGDLLSVDCGAIVDGWHGDAAVTIAIGEVAEPARRLMEVTEEALWRGLAAARPEGRVGDISHAVETYVRSQGDYGIVLDYTGHGIGSQMHQPPDVPNRGKPGRGPRLIPGLALAVEPMVVLGRPESSVLDDDWTVVTDDGSLAAHYEHTFALTERGAWVLTALDGGRERLEALGVPYGGP